LENAIFGEKKEIRILAGFRGAFFWANSGYFWLGHSISFFITFNRKRLGFSQILEKQVYSGRANI